MTLRPASLGEARGQREHLLREPRDVAIGAHVREATRVSRAEPSACVRRSYRTSARRRPDRVPQPGAGLVPLGFGGHQRAGIAFEKGDIGAEAADGDLDGQRAPPGHGRERPPDQRRLAVAAWRDEEDLLGRRQIADQPIELGDAVDERRRRHDLAVDERICITLNNIMVRSIT